jgi:hypothetical protein
MIFNTLGVGLARLYLMAQKKSFDSRFLLFTFQKDGDI